MTAYEGYYTGVAGVVKVRFDMANKKCVLLPLVPAGAAGEDSKAGAAAARPVLSMVYAGDGLFSCIENNSLMYFTTIDGEKFIASHKNPRFGTDAIKYIKIAEIASPKKLNYDLAGKKWLVRNMARHVVSGGEMCMADSAVYKELPGYVDFCGLKKIEGPEYAGIAAVTTRDQTDLRLFDAGGETWLRAGMFVYSDAAGARKLVSGVNRVVIKADGFNEWLRADKGAVVKFAAPPAGARIAVFAGEDVIFDSAADKDEIYVPEGGFIFFAGRAGDMLKAFAR